MGGVSFAPTHRVPPGGARAWDEPDATRPSVSALGGNLAVQVLEQRANGWAHVVCANGWSTWVDGRVLVSHAAAPTAAVVVAPARRSDWYALLERITTGPLAFGGAAAVIVGGFLPWLSAGSVSINAWDLGIVAVLRGSGSHDGVKVGAVLLIVALVALPQLTKKDLSALAVAALGGVANTLSLLVFLQNQRGDVSADVGIGLMMVFAGGSAILADFLMGLQRLGQVKT